MTAIAEARAKFIETLVSLGVRSDLAESLWEYAFLAGKMAGHDKAEKKVNETMTLVFGEKKEAQG
jgi:hypothetical protein